MNIEDYKIYKQLYIDEKIGPKYIENVISKILSLSASSTDKINNLIRYRFNKYTTDATADLIKQHFIHKYASIIIPQCDKHEIIINISKMFDNDVDSINEKIMSILEKRPTFFEKYNDYVCTSNFRLLIENLCIYYKKKGWESKVVDSNNTMYRLYIVEGK